MDFSFLDNSLIIIIFSAAGGILVTILTQKLLRKRGLFTYKVNNVKIGASAEDPIFGKVQVTWDNNPVKNLYFSEVELVNRSTSDYESVVARVFTNNTTFLSAKTDVVSTTSVLKLTDDYEKQIKVKAGKKPSDTQIKIFVSQKEYIIPTFNRGQIILFQLLNSPYEDEEPFIALDIIHKGIKLKYKESPIEIFGVPQIVATIIGSCLAIVFVGFIIAFSKSIIISAIGSFLAGWLILFPGVLTIKLWRYLRDLISG